LTGKKLSVRSIDVESSTRGAARRALRALSLEEEDNEPFYTCDLGDVYRKYKRWVKLLPRVVPHYAVKCNPDPMVLDSLAALGTGFDCASQCEIDYMINRGVDPAKIIYAHPCKPVAHLKYALRVGVKQMTFDNEDELEKIKLYHPEVKGRNGKGKEGGNGETYLKRRMIWILGVVE
jgi:diaminopimelate decarboxylase